MSSRVLRALLAVFVGALVLPVRTTHGQGKAPGPLDVSPPSLADLKVLDRLRGTWDVVVTTRSPQAGTIRYVETYQWVLDGKFLRGETLRKPDGTTDLYMTTYDARSRRYQFWIFTSQGTFVFLPFGTWNATSQSMEWKSGADWGGVSFTGRWTFPDANTRHSTTVVKDWKGKVLIDAEAHAVRRR